MTLKYDLHTHILHGVDDGAKTVEDSLLLIEALKDNGVENICLTPHFYTHKESMDDFLLKRNSAFEELKPHLPSDINFKLGAEVYVTKYLFSEERELSLLCIENTPYMITEFSYQSTFSDSTMNMIRRLRDFGIIPIIPHIERYPTLMKNKNVLSELVSMGVILQSNVSSFLSSSHKRKLISLIKKNYIDVLSTDTHSMNRNSPADISDALKFIEKKTSPEVISAFNDNAKDIFEGR